MKASVFLVLLAFISEAYAQNPLFSGADPHAVVSGGEVWIYPTGGGAPGEFYAWSSRDLKQWQKHGPILSFGEIPWIPADGAPRHLAWAPGMIERDGKFYLHYSVGPQNPTPSRIGVAVGDSPAGPFKDSGKALLTGGNGFEAIDPMIFKDPASGKYFHYCGGSAGAKLRIHELSGDLLGFTREVETETPEKFTEGAFMHHREGTYYLSYSHGNFRDATYSVHYSTSATPFGPWKYHGAILTSDSSHKGPGHHSFLCLPETGEWIVIYHRWDGRRGNGPYQGRRDIAIDRVEHAVDGTIRPIRMTDGGVTL